MPKSDDLPPLEEHHLGKLKRLEKELSALADVVDTLTASADAGMRIVRIPNPESAVNKIVLRYWAGNLMKGRYAEFHGDAFPNNTFRHLPILPADYNIKPNTDNDIIVRFKLKPGYCYRVFYRCHIGDEWDTPKSLGFFEVGIK